MARMLLLSYVLGVALLTTPFAHAEPILSTSGGSSFSGFNGSLGWEFQTDSSPVTVVALDAILGGGGSSSSTQVRLYNSLGTTLASATVSTADPTETAGLTWNSHAISPITLLPNTTYFIAQDNTNLDISFIVTSTPTLTHGVQYLGGVSENGAGLNPTSDSLGGHFDPAYFGPNFDPAGPAVIPEPSTLSILAAGLGIVAWWRKRRAAAMA